MQRIIIHLLAAAAMVGSARAETSVELIARTPCLFEYRSWFFTYRHGDVFTVPEGFTKEQCDAAIVADEQIPALMRAEVEADANVQLAARSEQLAAQIEALKKKQAQRQSLLASARRMSPDQLLAFAIKSAGKFPSELKGLPATFVVRVQAFSSDFLSATYDTDSAEMRLAYPIMIGASRWALQRCQPMGSFSGMNSFGARAIVQKQACTQVEIQHAVDSVLNVGGSGFPIPMPPNVYRSIKANGAHFDITMTVGAEKNQEVTVLLTDVTLATVKNPVEKHTKAWRVNGRYEKVELLAPGSNKPLVAF